MAYATAKSLPPDAIPVVDITPLRDGSDVAAVAAALHSASQGLGFIYIKGHGIPDEVITAARQQAYDFFRASSEQKQSVAVSPKHRGWLQSGAAKMGSDAKADLKESFVWGQQDDLGQALADHPLRGPNQWPSFVPSMESVAMTYYHHAHDVARHLMRGFAAGLNLSHDFFLRSCSRPMSRASFVYYPAQDEQCGVEQLGVAAHTDFGVLTVLCQDNTGGLQVQDINGEWLEAPPIEGTLVVNVGDLLSRWTAGEYKSTPHRVVNSSGRERLSLVLAFDPNPETQIDANDIPGLSRKGDAITCGDYLQWRFAKAFSYRNSDEKVSSV